jgi:hypothetical protein
MYLSRLAELSATQEMLKDGGILAPRIGRPLPVGI